MTSSIRNIEVGLEDSSSIRTTEMRQDTSSIYTAGSTQQEAQSLRRLLRSNENGRSDCDSMRLVYQDDGEQQDAASYHGRCSFDHLSRIVSIDRAVEAFHVHEWRLRMSYRVPIKTASFAVSSRPATVRFTRWHASILRQPYPSDHYSEDEKLIFDGEWFHPGLPKLHIFQVIFCPSTTHPSTPFHVLPTEYWSVALPALDHCLATKFDPDTLPPEARPDLTRIFTQLSTALEANEFERTFPYHIY